jgi:hypothetical protein
MQTMISCHRNMLDKTLSIVGAGFCCHAGMPLVQNLRAEVNNWLDRNAASDPRICVHRRPLANWPEFPDGKFWAGLRLVDPHDNRGFEEWMVDLLKTADTFPACVQTFHVLRRGSGRRNPLQRSQRNPDSGELQQDSYRSVVHDNRDWVNVELVRRIHRAFGAGRSTTTASVIKQSARKPS